MNETQGDPLELVMVYKTTDVAHAELIKAALQAEGIACELGGESQVFSGVLDIEVWVRAMDADRAAKFIESHERHGGDA